MAFFGTAVASAGPLSSTYPGQSPSAPTSSLAQYSTCEVSDALVKLGIPSGGHIPDIDMYSPSPSQDAATGKICGPAFTVKMVVASDKTSPKPATHFVDACPEGHVMFVSAPPRKFGKHQRDVKLTLER